MTDPKLDGDEPGIGTGASLESIERDSLALSRDHDAEDRDGEATERDHDAAARDHDSEDQDVLSGRNAPRRQDDRIAASEDRSASADDREMASQDRDAAAGDRNAATSEIASLLRDQLTGIYQRSVGLRELGREILKARRTGEPFTLAFIDIDHLKATNDASVHGGGDRLIATTVTAIQSVVRNYDIVVRYGGDGFLCGALGLTLADAEDRFEHMNAAMALTGGGTASFGVVELGQEEDLDDLISRADAAMYDRKRQPPSANPDSDDGLRELIETLSGGLSEMQDVERRLAETMDQIQAHTDEYPGTKARVEQVLARNLLSTPSTRERWSGSGIRPSTAGE